MPNNTSQSGRNWKYLFIFLASVAFIFLPLFFEKQLLALKSFGLLGLFIVNLVGSATIFFPAPVILSVGVAGHLYNPLLVALIASLGQALGEGTGYLFGFSSKRIINHQKHTLFFTVVHGLFKKYGWLIILIFSIIPNPVMDGIGIIAGLSSYPVKKFFALVFIGRLIRNIGVAYLGALL